MAIKKVNDASLTSVADAIREKGGTTANLYFPDGFVDAIEAIPTGGDTLYELYVKRTIEDYTNDMHGTLPNYMFASSYIKSVDFPNVETIGSGVFYNCSNLTTANFPKCKNITSKAFELSGLTSINLPQATVIQSNAFANCTKVQAVNLPLVVNIYDYAFQTAFPSQSPIEEINLPELTNLQVNAFNGANVKKVNMPKLQNLGQYAFQGSKLEEITIPATIQTISQRALWNVYGLKKVIIEADLTTYPNGLLNTNNAMEELSMLNCTQVPTLANTSLNIPNTCVIKVPAALEAEWKTATNWANFASQIQGV